jgi:hypothetical protein
MTRTWRCELVHLRGAWPLLMKQRNSGKRTPEEKIKLKIIEMGRHTLTLTVL